MVFRVVSVDLMDDSGSFRVIWEGFRVFQRRLRNVSEGEKSISSLRDRFRGSQRTGAFRRVSWEILGVSEGLRMLLVRYVYIPETFQWVSGIFKAVPSISRGSGDLERSARCFHWDYRGVSEALQGVSEEF